jgi:hypothetical protein
VARRRGQPLRHRQELHVPEEISGGGVDQRHGTGALRHPLGMPFGPGGDRDAAHRVAGDQRALFGPHRGGQHRVEVGGEVVEAVVAVTARDPAATVAAVVEGDHPVVAGQLGDLMGPHPQRTGDAVGQDDRRGVVGPEHLGVDAHAVDRPHRDRAAVRQRLGGGQAAAPSGRAVSLCHRSLRSPPATLP